jgi:sulfite exporter TauE/SafE
MNFPEGILLGLSTGAICLAYCGPVIIPYLLGENKNIQTNFVYVSLFLSGRLLAYLVIGLIAGIAGTLFLQPSGFTIKLIGVSYVFLSILLIVYGFHRFKEVCLGKTQIKVTSGYFKNRPYVAPLIGGILTGLNICPPLILAVTKAASTHDIAGSILFFMMFFIGTSLYFIPLPFIGIFKRQHVLRIIGKFAAILAGLIYLYKGLFMIIN